MIDFNTNILRQLAQRAHNDGQYTTSITLWFTSIFTPAEEAVLSICLLFSRITAETTGRIAVNLGAGGHVPEL